MVSTNVQLYIAIYISGPLFPQRITAYFYNFAGMDGDSPPSAYSPEIAYPPGVKNKYASTTQPVPSTSSLIQPPIEVIPVECEDENKRYRYKFNIQLYTPATLSSPVRPIFYFIDSAPTQPILIPFPCISLKKRTDTYSYRDT